MLARLEAASFNASGTRLGQATSCSNSAGADEDEIELALASPDPDSASVLGRPGLRFGRGEEMTGSRSLRTTSSCLARATWTLPARREPISVRTF